jgi:hypothetical protein
MAGGQAAVRFTRYPKPESFEVTPRTRRGEQEFSDTQESDGGASEIGANPKPPDGRSHTKQQRRQLREKSVSTFRLRSDVSAHPAPRFMFRASMRSKDSLSRQLWKARAIRHRGECRRTGPYRNGNAGALRWVERAEGQLRFRRSDQTLGPSGRNRRCHPFCRIRQGFVH